MISLMKAFRRQAGALNSFARIIPLLCQWNNGSWQSVAPGRRIEVTVVGWRVS
jgi:hypothetical protein